jgi:hypothetical protein
VVNGEGVRAPEENSRSDSGHANRITWIGIGADGETNCSRSGREEAAWKQVVSLCM